MEFKKLKEQVEGKLVGIAVVLKKLVKDPEAMADGYPDAMGG